MLFILYAIPPPKKKTLERNTFLLQAKETISEVLQLKLLKPMWICARVILSFQEQNLNPKRCWKHLETFKLLAYSSSSLASLDSEFKQQFIQKCLQILKKANQWKWNQKSKNGSEIQLNNNLKTQKKQNKNRNKYNTPHRHYLLYFGALFSQKQKTLNLPVCWFCVSASSRWKTNDIFHYLGEIFYQTKKIHFLISFISDVCFSGVNLGCKALPQSVWKGTKNHIFFSS